MPSNFYAVLGRMKYINRWGLMRSVRNENLSEHCLDTAFFAHMLVIIHNKKFGGALSPEHAAVCAMFHDASEIITGDMPTPVKYFNPEIRSAYKTAESAAQAKLASYLPDEFREDITQYIEFESREPDYAPFVKAADKLSALAKCIEERGMGNREFKDAEQKTRGAIHALNLPAAEYFLDEFMDAFALTLDEQGQ